MSDKDQTYIAKLEEYIDFLTDIYNDAYYHARRSNYVESQFNLNKGRKLRQELEDLKNGRK